MDLTQAKEPPAARFQRTDQWKPVYAWLESLDKDEVVKSKDITDWLEEQPSVKEKLCARHSRYHLMHYIQKCHMKILKRRGKLQKVSTVVSKQKVSGDILVIQGVQQSITKPSPRISYDGAAILALPLTATPSRALITNKPSKDLNRDKDESAAKREEAFRRYELLNTTFVNKLLLDLNSLSNGVENGLVLQKFRWRDIQSGDCDQYT
ncbi:hypothetical protein GIB67_009337 [Kingdonia uniflora]|uniref:Uncharacterized protein n=1 Tax=Kingdonia uniflora TaxID=39325 RepID=A0A7J7N3H6_9MAGN|nr:hypothetical protein GIB67_009337 [Kingdonia uniflora]